MANGVADKSIMVNQFHFSQAEDIYLSIYLPSEHRCNTIRAVVRFQAQWLLTSPIPHAHHKDKTRVDDGFDKAEEKAVDGDAREVVACRCCHEQPTPNCICTLEKFPYSRMFRIYTYRCAAKKFSDRKLLESQSSWPLGDQIAEIKD